MVKNISTYKKRTPEEDVPAGLVRDVIDGQPFYYKGYREVLNKTKTIEEIMGCSTLQSFIVMYLQHILMMKLGIEEYHIFSNETGLHFSKRVNYGLDLAVYDVKTLPFAAIDEHYAKVAPLLVVEVDVKVDTEDLTDQEFIELKTKSLVTHGAGKIIWVSSKSKKILIAETGKEWITQSWYEEFELMHGIKANVGEFLRERKIPAAL